MSKYCCDTFESQITADHLFVANEEIKVFANFFECYQGECEAVSTEIKYCPWCGKRISPICKCCGQILKKD